MRSSTPPSPMPTRSRARSNPYSGSPGADQLAANATELIPSSMTAPTVAATRRGASLDLLVRGVAARADRAISAARAATWATTSGAGARPPMDLRVSTNGRTTAYPSSSGSKPRIRRSTSVSVGRSRRISSMQSSPDIMEIPPPPRAGCARQPWPVSVAP